MSLLKDATLRKAVGADSTRCKLDIVQDRIMRPGDFVFNQPAACWTAKLAKLDAVVNKALGVTD